MAHILIIDDEEAMRSGLRMVLEAAGHRVREAGDGAAGLQLLRCEPADLVFCDLFMPGQEGLETIRMLRQEMPDLKVVAMSGGGFCGRVNLLEVAVKLGASGALVKPFDAADALTAVETMLHGAATG